MIDMVNKDILPAVSKYVGKLSKTAATKKSCFAGADCTYEEKTVTKLSALSGSIYTKVTDLEDSFIDLKNAGGVVEEAEMFKSVIIPKMQELRAVTDEAECITSAEYWPYPSYGELLFGVR